MYHQFYSFLVAISGTFDDRRESTNQVPQFALQGEVPVYAE
jgi:hypothetical protein